MWQIVLFAASILMCTSRREEDEDNMDMKVNGYAHEHGNVEGFSHDATCGSVELENNLEDFHTHLKTNTNENKKTLTDASSLFSEAEKAVKRVEDIHALLVNKKKLAEADQDTLQRQHGPLIKQLKKREDTLKIDAFLLQEFAKITNPFLDRSSRWKHHEGGQTSHSSKLTISGEENEGYMQWEQEFRQIDATPSYRGCDAMAGGGVDRLVTEFGKIIKDFKVPDNYRTITAHQLTTACFSKAVDMLNEDGEYKKSGDDADREQAFIDSFFQGPDEDAEEDQFGDDSEGLEAHSCLSICEQFAHKMNTVEDSFYSKTIFAKNENRLKELEGKVERLQLHIEEMDRMLQGCRAAVASIQNDVIQLGLKYTRYFNSSDEYSKTSLEIKDKSATIKMWKEKLQVTNRQVDQLSKSCADKKGMMQNMTCQLKELESELIIKMQKVSSLEHDSAEEQKKTTAITKAMQEYENLKINLFRLLQKWSTTSYMLMMKTGIEMKKNKVALEIHENFIERCSVTQQAFETIHQYSDLQQNLLPKIWTEMEDSINIANTIGEMSKVQITQKSEHLLQHLEQTFLSYDQTFFDETFKAEQDVISLTYDDENFQKMVMTFMSACAQTQKSFCSTYMIGWLKGDTCKKQNPCKKPCIMDQTCQAPPDASKYLLELRIRNLLEGQQSKYNEFIEQLTQVQTAVLSLRLKIKVLTEQKGKMSVEQKGCQEKVGHIKNHIMVNWETELNIIKQDLKALEQRKQRVLMEKKRYQNEGVEHMAQIQKIALEMKQHRIDAAKAALMFANM